VPYYAVLCYAMRCDIVHIIEQSFSYHLDRLCCYLLILFFPYPPLSHTHPHTLTHTHTHTHTHTVKCTTPSSTFTKSRDTGGKGGRVESHLCGVTRNSYGTLPTPVINADCPTSVVFEKDPDIRCSRALLL
jgi:hypothetical protein